MLRRLVLAGVATLGSIRPVAAHEPVFDLPIGVQPVIVEDVRSQTGGRGSAAGGAQVQPVIVEDVRSQRGYDAALARPWEVGSFQVALSEPRPVQAWLLVPEAPGCANFAPQLALLSLGVGDDVAALAVPAGFGATVFTVERWGRWVDPDTRLVYRAGPRIVPDLEPGDHNLAVLDPSGATGHYLLLFGDLDGKPSETDWETLAAEHHRCGG